MNSPDNDLVDADTRRRSAFFLGIKTCFAPAAIVLMFSFFGFGAYARESGFSLANTIFVSFFVWALPGQVVLVSEVAAGATMVAAAIAVTLTAVRLLPLAVTLLPVLREPETPKWKQYVLTHFMAITVWVESMRLLPSMPRDERIPFYTGFCALLISLNMVTTAVGYELAGILSPKFAAGLLFLTPLYFLLSLTKVAGDNANKLALVFGFVLGPVLFAWLPGFELLLAGLIGGTVAYFIGRKWAGAG